MAGTLVFKDGIYRTAKDEKLARLLSDGYKVVEDAPEAPKRSGGRKDKKPADEQTPAE